MPLNLTGLRAELVARGFDYLSQARQDRFINDAMYAIDDLDTWSYLQANATGVTPLTISDLGRIESVANVANLQALTFMDRRDLVEDFADLTLTGGTPAYYYLTGGTVLNAFPVAASVSLTVRYYKVAPELAAGSDVPLMPDRFRYAIVDYAVAKALEDVSNYAEAQAARASGDATVARMREWDLLQSGGASGQYITGASGDW